MTYEDLRTPFFVIDKHQFNTNCDKVLKLARQLGVRPRPHVKTHKTLQGGLLQTGGEPGPIAVSTLAEADFYARNGFTDILYAFPITPDKFPAVIYWNRTISLSVLTDSSDVISRLEQALQDTDITINVMLKINAGAGRAGWHYSETDVIASAATQLMQSSRLTFGGLMTHAHHAYASASPADSKTYLAEEDANLSSLLEQLRSRDIEPPAISTGSTPTTLNQQERGVTTEIRPGNYTLFDRFQADIGSCRREEIAGYVVARVAGHYPHRNQLLIDAGALAFSKDRGATHVRSWITYGEALDYPHLQVEEISQEHGMVSSREPIDFASFPIGTPIKFIPNHSCLTAACFDRYYVEDVDEITDTWHPERGW